MLEIWYKIARSKHLDPLNKDKVRHDLPHLRAAYNQDPSPLNLSNLVMALRLEGHQIEIERKMARAIVKNKQLLGPSNPHTMELELGIKGLKARRLKMSEKDTTDGIWAYRLVRYEDDYTRCVIVPMVTAHDFVGGKDYQGDEKEFSMTIGEFHDKFILCDGTPIMCIGLKSPKGAQLNGKIGDSRKYNKETLRYEIILKTRHRNPRVSR